MESAKLIISASDQEKEKISHEELMEIKADLERKKTDLHAVVSIL
jgi:hypothetical protein